MQRSVAIVAAVLMAATRSAGHIVLAEAPDYSTSNCGISFAVNGGDEEVPRIVP